MKITLGDKLKMLRPFVKPFLVVFLIYLVAMLAVMRSGVSFIDDQRRAIHGNAWLTDFNRLSSTAFGLLMNLNDRLLDISPWTQILAFGILSVVCVMLTYVFCDKKIKYLPLVLSAFVGLMPLTVECWLYKFDAPCMALSIFVSVLPILWWPKVWERKQITRFCVISVTSMLIMWTTYQASSGIFPVLCVYMTLRDYLRGEKASLCMKKLAISAGMVILAALIFKFCLPEPVWSYRDTSMHELSNLVPGVFTNLFKYIEMMVGSLNVWQMIFAGATMIGAIVLVFMKFRMKGFLVVLAFIIALPLSIGAYLLLSDPTFTPRSLIGVWASFVPILIMVTKDAKTVKEYCFAAPGIIMLYSVVAFALALGNGMADQERWANFRVENLVGELAKLYPTQAEVDAKKIRVEGNIGYSAVMQHVANKYPATSQIITPQQVGLSGEVWGLMKIKSYYNRQQEFEMGYDDGYCADATNVRLDTYYFTIRDNNEKVCVELK